MVKHLRWSFFKNYLAAFSCSGKLFSQEASSQMLDRVTLLLDRVTLFPANFMQLLGILTCVELLQQIYLRFLTGFDMLVFFTNLNFAEFRLGCLVLFLYFPVIDNFARNNFYQKKRGKAKQGGQSRNGGCYIILRFFLRFLIIKHRQKSLMCLSFFWLGFVKIIP